MSRRTLAVTGAFCLSLLALAVGTRTPVRAADADWAANMTVIEACSCPMFCQCYFNTKPAAHATGGEHSHHGSTHFCRANLAYKINKGHFGQTSLDGAKFWVATDLGGDFSKGELDWGVLYFDKGLTKPQRDAIATVAGRIFPVKWQSFATAEASIDTWEITPTGAVALMDGGKTAEVRLKKFQGMTDGPVVIRNLKYWGAPRNEGFIMAPNEVEAYRVGPKAFEFKGTNGFLITIDMNSNDFAS
jgi:uncharacterized protein DUF1326